MIIRKFKKDDEEAVINLVDSILKELQIIEDNGIVIDDEDLRNIPQIYSGRSAFWVAQDDSGVVGTVGIRELGDAIAKLSRMFVRSEYRGTGLGQELLDTAIHFAKKQRFQKIVLNTHILMERAHRFYEKNGFIRVDQNQDKYHYVKDLY